MQFASVWSYLKVLSVALVVRGFNDKTWTTRGNNFDGWLLYVMLLLGAAKATNNAIIKTFCWCWRPSIIKFVFPQIGQKGTLSTLMQQQVKTWMNFNILKTKRSPFCRRYFQMTDENLRILIHISLAFISKVATDNKPVLNYVMACCLIEWINDDPVHVSGMLCYKQLSRAWTSNCIPKILWDVITCPCPWYLLQTPSSSYASLGLNQSKVHSWTISLTRCHVYPLVTM